MPATLRRERSRALERALARTNFENLIVRSAQLATIAIGLIAVLAVLKVGQSVLAPLFLAITVGLMFGPIARWLEARGMVPGISAALVVLLFMLLIAGAGLLFFQPLMDWATRIPRLWARLQTEIASLREPLKSLGALQDQVQGALGEDQAVAVTVNDGGPVASAAAVIPAVLAAVLIFLVSLYFYLATRDSIRVATLRLCISRSMRWRTAHVFRDVEDKVSRYLITITLVNVGVGIVVGGLMALIGLPSPLLWGALAFVLNYIPFLGQAGLAALLFFTGLGSGGILGSGLIGGLLPMGLYFLVNFIEGNFVTPNLLGRAMTINPFLIFLSLAIWIWAWGAVGGLIAVPSLLIITSILGHILPTAPSLSAKTRRETAGIEERRAVLAAGVAEETPSA